MSVSRSASGSRSAGRFPAAAIGEFRAPDDDDAVLIAQGLALGFPLLVKAVEEMTGFTAGAAAFGTEGPYFQELGMEAVIFGPGGIETAHQPDEHLEIASLQPTIEKLAELVRRFCL